MSTYYEKDFKREEKGLAPISADARHIVRHLWIVAVFLPVVCAIAGAILVSLAR